MNLDKIYTSMIQIKKDFFPALYKEYLKKRLEKETPEETGKRLCHELFQRFRKDNDGYTA